MKKLDRNVSAAELSERRGYLVAKLEARRAELDLSPHAHVSFGRPALEEDVIFNEGVATEGYEVFGGKARARLTFSDSPAKGGEASFLMAELFALSGRSALIRVAQVSYVTKAGAGTFRHVGVGGATQVEFESVSLCSELLGNIRTFVDSAIGTIE